MRRGLLAWVVTGLLLAGVAVVPEASAAEPAKPVTVTYKWKIREFSSTCAAGSVHPLCVALSGVGVGSVLEGSFAYDAGAVPTVTSTDGSSVWSEFEGQPHQFAVKVGTKVYQPAPWYNKATVANRVGSSGVSLSIAGGDLETEDMTATAALIGTKLEKWATVEALPTSLNLSDFAGCRHDKGIDNPPHTYVFAYVAQEALVPFQGEKELIEVMKLESFEATGCVESWSWSGPAVFVDVPAGHPFKVEIEWLAGLGITKGCTADGKKFCPADVVTRGQMAAFLHRALPALPLKAACAPFTDTSGSIFKADIDWLCQTGVTVGYGDGRFGPNDKVTRAQMASFLARALGLAAGVNTFVDDDGSVHEADIGALAGSGITKGCTVDGTRFCPKDPVTRGQMAAFLYRGLSG